MLRLCAGCDRHVRLHGPCPYCGGHEAQPVPSQLGWARVRRGAVAAIAASVMTAACGESVAGIPIYGLPDEEPLLPPFDAGREASGPLLPPADARAPADTGARDAGADGGGDGGGDGSPGDSGDAASD